MMTTKIDRMQATESARIIPLRSVRCVVRAAKLLESFSRARPELSLTEASELAGLDKGTARRLLFTLQSVGFVRRNPATLTYSLDDKLLTISAAVPRSGYLQNPATRIIDRLAHETGTSAFFSIFHDGKALCIYQHVSNTAVEVRWPLGTHMPLNCGAGPRVLLAYRSEGEISAVLKSKFPKLTPLSITEPDIIKRKLKLIRKRGWESAVDDVVIGLMGLGAPVRNAEGHVVAAVSISGLTPQLRGAKMSGQLKHITDAAQEISANLDSFGVRIAI
jgi:DNA-binding IclR family transcriptional regulator